MDIRVKNNDTSNHTWGGKVFSPDEIYTLQPADEVSFNTDAMLFIDIANGNALIGNLDEFYTDPITGWEFLSSGGRSKVTVIELPESKPFAQPTFRTKRNATDSIITIVPNTYEHIDFQLTAERYISGGCLIGDNVQLGDYVTGCIYDKDEVIPEAYRAALCENWPVVALYIEKEWVEVNCTGTTKHKIDTYPLNAKITGGLYLRLTYYATSVGLDRHIAFNYYLTKKL